jgi:hypothetical protein
MHGAAEHHGRPVVQVGLSRLDGEEHPCQIGFQNLFESRRQSAANPCSAWQMPHMLTVSKEIHSWSEVDTEKFSFSNPMRRPVRSFIRMPASPISSHVYSSDGFPNHAVKVFPVRAMP